MRAVRLRHEPFDLIAKQRAFCEQSSRSEKSLSFDWSGCWESNPVYTHPKRVYYRYTTARNYLITKHTRYNNQKCH